MSHLRHPRLLCRSGAGHSAYARRKTVWFRPRIDRHTPTDPFHADRAARPEASSSLRCLSRPGHVCAEPHHSSTRYCRYATIARTCDTEAARIKRYCLPLSGRDRVRRRGTDRMLTKHGKLRHYLLFQCIDVSSFLHIVMDAYTSLCSLNAAPHLFQRCKEPVGGNDSDAP